MLGAPRQTRSTPDSVNARQSLRVPGSGWPMATTRRLSAAMTTCGFVEYRARKGPARPRSADTAAPRATARRPGRVHRPGPGSAPPWRAASRPRYRRSARRRTGPGPSSPGRVGASGTAAARAADPARDPTAYARTPSSTPAALRPGSRATRAHSATGTPRAAPTQSFHARSRQPVRSRGPPGRRADRGCRVERTDAALRFFHGVSGQPVILDRLPRGDVA